MPAIKNNLSKIWFITGCSSGFGKEMVSQLLALGERVVATARKIETLNEFTSDKSQLLKLSVDVTSDDSIKKAVSHTLDHFGQIDVLVNNAGFGIVGAIEEVSDAEVRNVYETNVFGTLNMTKAVLPSMRSRKSGHIMMISSIAGLRGSSGYGIYQSSKFAVEGFSDALAQEVAPLDIKVTIVEPGPFRTDFLSKSHSIKIAQKTIDDYASTSGQTRIYADNNHGKQVGDPVRAVELMIESILKPRDTIRLPLGAFTIDKGREKLQSVERDFKIWENEARSTDR